MGKRLGDAVVGEREDGIGVAIKVGVLEVVLVGAAVGDLVGFKLLVGDTGATMGVLVGGKLLIGASVGALVGGILLIKDVGLAEGVLEGGSFTVGTAVGAYLE